MRRVLIATLAFAIFPWYAVSGDEKPEEPPIFPGLSVGVVHEDAVYAANSPLTVYRGEVFGQELRLSRIGPFDYFGTFRASADFPPRWQLRHGVLTLVNANPWEDRSLYGCGSTGFYTYGIPLADIEKRLADEWRARPPKKGKPLDLDEQQGFPHCVTEDKATNLLHVISRAMVVYVNDRDSVQNYDHPFSNYEFFYDLLPLKGGGSDYVIIASESLQEKLEQLRKEPGEQLVKGEKPPAVYYPVDWEKAKEPLKPMLGFWHKDKHGQWALVDQVKNPCFNERFHIFPQGTAYYFVTDSGKVYISEKPAKGQRQIQEVWVDKQRPINGAITDTASGKTFLFGAEAKDRTKLFYFELSEKPQPCEFARRTLVDKQLPPPLNIPVAYTFLLVADKKIKVEPKPEPKPGPEPEKKPEPEPKQRDPKPCK